MSMSSLALFLPYKGFVPTEALQWTIEAPYNHKKAFCHVLALKDVQKTDIADWNPAMNKYLKALGAYNILHTSMFKLINCLAQTQPMRVNLLSVD